MLGVIAVGVVLSAIEPARPDVPLVDIELAADAPDLAVGRTRSHDDGHAAGRSCCPWCAAVDLRHRPGRGGQGRLARAADLGRAQRAAHRPRRRRPAARPPARLFVTRAALPLVVLAGIGEIVGSTLSAWGATDSIAVVAVLGSQFAAIAAVVAYFLFGERLSRMQTVGVVAIVIGVTALAVVST